MALTITEKHHWKNRIESKLGDRIWELRASDPELTARFRELARKDTRVGLDHDFSRLDELDSLQVATEEAVEKLLSEIYKKATGEESGCHLTRILIERKLSVLQDERFEEILRDHELGHRIAMVQKRKEELADSILLATNIQQIINAWDEVTSLLSDKPEEPEQEQESLFGEAA